LKSKTHDGSILFTSKFIKGNIAIILVVLIALGGAILAGFYLYPEKTKEIGNSIPKLVFSPQPSIAPFPFQELTIPYLRSREYKSSLGELEKYSENSNYTTYLTDYNSDGLKINGLLTIPKGGSAGKYPAIVFVHGYIAPSIYKTTERYSDHIDFLARNGFVVFKIDLRGHDQSEGEAGGSYYSGDYIIDTLNAYAALQGADFVDPKRVGLWGHSMAGNVTFRSFVAKQDIPAVAIWAGAGFTYSDLQEYRIMDQSYRAPQQTTERARKRQELRDKYGDFNPESEFWKQVTPINYLTGISGTVGLFHAINDTVVSIAYSRNLDNILNQSGIPHEYYEYPSGEHNIEGFSFTQAMQKTVEFFKKNL
jgi:dipeptidyl aminopeptidase/acylaminoacyl peptidase